MRRANSVPSGRIRYLVSSTQPGKGRALCGLLLFLKPARDPRRSREAERERKFPAPDSGWEIPRKLPGVFFCFFFFPQHPRPSMPGECPQVGPRSLVSPRLCLFLEERNCPVRSRSSTRIPDLSPSSGHTAAQEGPATNSHGGRDACAVSSASD